MKAKIFALRKTIVGLVLLLLVVMMVAADLGHHFLDLAMVELMVIVDFCGGDHCDGYD